MPVTGASHCHQTERVNSGAPCNGSPGSLVAPRAFAGCIASRVLMGVRALNMSFIGPCTSVMLKAELTSTCTKCGTFETVRNGREKAPRNPLTTGRRFDKLLPVE